MIVLYWKSQNCADQIFLLELLLVLNEWRTFPLTCSYTGTWRQYKVIIIFHNFQSTIERGLQLSIFLISVSLCSYPYVVPEKWMISPTNLEFSCLQGRLFTLGIPCRILLSYFLSVLLAMWSAFIFFTILFTSCNLVWDQTHSFVFLSFLTILILDLSIALWVTLNHWVVCTIDAHVSQTWHVTSQVIYICTWDSVVSWCLESGLYSSKRTPYHITFI